jgi:hypothetical protein
MYLCVCPGSRLLLHAVNMLDLFPLWSGNAFTRYTQLLVTLSFHKYNKLFVDLSPLQPFEPFYPTPVPSIVLTTMPHAVPLSSQGETRHHIDLSDLKPDTYKAYTVVSARLYHTPFGAAQGDWTYSQKGLLVFGRDRGSTQKSDSSSSIGSSDTTKYWFRLVDEISGRTVWMFKTPVGLDYQKDKPFFHVFTGKVCTIFFMSPVTVYILVTCVCRAECLAFALITTTRPHSSSRKSRNGHLLNPNVKTVLLFLIYNRPLLPLNLHIPQQWRNLRRQETRKSPSRPSRAKHESRHRSSLLPRPSLLSMSPT